MRIHTTKSRLLLVIAIAATVGLAAAATRWGPGSAAEGQDRPNRESHFRGPSLAGHEDPGNAATQPRPKVTAKFHRQRDLRSAPVKRLVALGESTTWGYSVSAKEKCWVSQVARMLEEFQGTKIEVVNQGIGSNVLTTACPSYEYSAKPSALERLDVELIALKPDMVFLSYGLNDSRGGTPVETFRKAYQELIDRIRAKIDPTIVIVNTYYMHEFLYDHCPHWEESSYDVTDVFNAVIRQLAEANGLILADIYSAEVGVDWIIDEDHCHPNDLGHRIIANRVFEALVRNCSFPACRMPKRTLISEFGRKYGNGPERPGGR
jgi:lysophospholipase L1-like esterase